MGQPAPIPRRSSHLGSAACYGRSDHGSHSSTSAASSRSKRRQGNHNQFQTLKMFPDGHLEARFSRFFAGIKGKAIEPVHVMDAMRHLEKIDGEYVAYLDQKYNNVFTRLLETSKDIGSEVAAETPRE